MATPNEAKSSESNENYNDNDGLFQLLAMIGMEEWVKLKKKNIGNDEFLSILQSLYNQNQCNPGNFSKLSIAKLKHYLEENVCKFTHFLNYILNQLEKDSANQSRLIDLYLEMISVRLAIANMNQLAIDHFQCMDNIWMTQNRWKDTEQIFNVMIPNVLDSFSKTETMTASLTCDDIKTIIKITKHGASTESAYYLTIECKHYKRNS